MEFLWAFFDVSKCLFGKVFLLKFEEFYGLQDDLKNILKMLSPTRYPVPKICPRDPSFSYFSEFSAVFSTRKQNSLWKFYWKLRIEFQNLMINILGYFLGYQTKYGYVSVLFCTSTLVLRLFFKSGFMGREVQVEVKSMGRSTEKVELMRSHILFA